MNICSKVILLASSLTLSSMALSGEALSLYQLDSLYYNEGKDGLYLALKDAPTDTGVKAQQIAALIASNALDLDTGIELIRRLSTCNNCSEAANALNRILTEANSSNLDKIIAASGLLAVKDKASRQMLAKYYKTYQSQQDEVISYLESNLHKIILSPP